MELAAFFKKLDDENLSALEREAKVSRQALHSARKSMNMKLENLNSVAKAMGFRVNFEPLATEENLLASLVEFGVPVAHSGGGTFSFVEMLAEGLKTARRDGAYESFVPYALVKNVGKLDPLALAAVAFQVNQVNTLGYFAEMANAFQPHAHFAKLLCLLEPAKNDEREFLVRDQKTNFPELFLKNHLALKWNLLVRGTPVNHFERWKKWQAAHRNS